MPNTANESMQLVARRRRQNLIGQIVAIIVYGIISRELLGGEYLVGIALYLLTKDLLPTKRRLNAALREGICGTQPYNSNFDVRTGSWWPRRALVYYRVSGETGWATLDHEFTIPGCRPVGGTDDDGLAEVHHRLMTELYSHWVQYNQATHRPPS